MHRRSSRRAPGAAGVGAAAADGEPAALGCSTARPVVATAPSAAAGVGRHDAAALRDTPARVRGKAGKQPITSLFADLPDYLRDNEYITRYYRADYSVRESLASLFRVHNETGNIWSHLAGAALLSAIVPTAAVTILLWPESLNEMRVSALADRVSKMLACDHTGSPGSGVVK